MQYIIKISIISAYLTYFALSNLLPAWATIVDVCQDVRNSYRRCFSEQQNFLECSGIAPGFHNCRQAGGSHAICKNAQAGFEPCYRQTRNLDRCLNALSGYSICMRSPDHGDCILAGLNYDICRAKILPHASCLHSMGFKENFACRLE